MDEYHFTLILVRWVAAQEPDFNLDQKIEDGVYLEDLQDYMEEEEYDIIKNLGVRTEWLCRGLNPSNLNKVYNAIPIE